MHEWQETEIGHLPIEWSIQTLLDVALPEKGSIISGPFGSNISSKYFVDSGIPVIRGNNLTLDIGTKFVDDGFVFVTEEKADTLNTWATPSDLVFTAAGTIGQVGLIANNLKYPRYIISNKQLRVTLNRAKISPLFAYYWFAASFMQDWIIYCDTGSTIPLINLTILKSLPVPLPPLKEQEAITAVLASLDDKIDLLHRQNKTLEALAQPLFRHWFIDGIKKDWEKHTLEEFVEVMRGLSYKGTGLVEEGEGVPMHNLNSVYEGGDYKYEGIKYYKSEFKDKHKVFPGDIIITNTEQGHDLLLIGYPAVVPKFFGNEGIFSQHIYRLNIIDARITNQFLYYLLMSYDVREQITGATNGSTVNMLPKDGIEWATFKLPPRNLIERFSEMTQQYWDKKEANYVQIRTLEKLRDTLLPKLMSGEVRVRLQ